MYVILHRPRNTEDDVLPNILAMVGNTPLVRLDKIAKAEGLECDLCKQANYVIVIHYCLPCYAIK